MLRDMYHAEARVMLRMGLFLAAVLLPVQLFFGHLVGDYVHEHQPAKFAAIEAAGTTEQPASEVMIAHARRGHRDQPLRDQDPRARQHHRQHEHDVEGSWADRSFRRRTGRRSLIPFFDLPGHGRLRLDDAGLAWFGSWLIIKQRIEKSRWLLCCIFLEFSAAVHRERWRLVHRRGRAAAVGRLRRAADRQGRDAVPDGARGDDLVDPVRCAVYAFIFSFGIYYIYRLLRAGPGALAAVPADAMPNRPMSLADPKPVCTSHFIQAGE